MRGDGECQKKIQQLDFAFGTSFRKMREKCDYTREQIADRAGISPRFLAAIENENRKPSLDVLIRLVHSIGVSFDEVLEPHLATQSETTDRIRRLVSQCSKRDQELLLTLINQMLDTKEKESKPRPKGRGMNNNPIRVNNTSGA